MLSILARLFLNLLRVLVSPLALVVHRMARPKARWVHVRLRPKLVEIERPVSRFMERLPWVSEARPTSLSLLRELVDQIVDDDRIEGVVFDVPPLSAGWATCHSLRELLVRLKQADRRVVVFLSEGGGNRELYVASAADRIVATPRSQLTPLGLAASVTYFKGLLDRAGLEVEVHRRAEYKTAAEPTTRDSMSDEQREQTDALLTVLHGALRDAFLERKGLDAEKVDRFFEEALIGAEQAVDLGLIDAVGYEDELPTWLRDGREVTPVVRAPRYYAWRSYRVLVPVVPERFIAVVPVHGTIRGGGAGSAGGRKLSSTVAALRLARQSRQVAGVVLHVDSPGGSVLASDLIYREVQRLREKKPVVASFGDVAASGGYYVSAGTDAVIAQPFTITGSIGVVSARLVTAGLFEKLGVRVDTVRKAPNADLMSRADRLDEGQAAILDREIDGFYRSFVKLVADGRSRSVDEVEPLARGRVWSGRDAHARGLVDALGGLDRALDEVRTRLAERLPKGRAQKLRARMLRAPMLELPPPEPRKVGEEAALALLGGISPGARDLMEMVGNGKDRVFAYAIDLPRID